MSRAIVLLSGGLDSATLLAIAKKQNFSCYTLSFDYGQIHRSELTAAAKIAKQLNVEEHKVMKVPIGTLGGSALTDTDIPIPNESVAGIPVTYVPARNTIFLSLALAWAEVLDAKAIFIGVNAIDYSGYPDCRPEFVSAFQLLVNIATKQGLEGDFIEIKTPLIDMTKAEIISKGVNLGLDYSITVSCYKADTLGRACGGCDACRFRKEGFKAAGLVDPTQYQPV
ncbi:MAG: 7-cyano-7-deazaguanine synthase QueC [Rhodospirillaceae bacterium]|nr:7-cyano-7-deazaguanine synthase QueC [Rhodospirillaceae bacterium]